MINTCTRDCLDRKPGCDCERRRAYKWQQTRIAEAKRKDRIVSDYRRDRIRSSRKKHRRPPWDQ